MRKEKPCQETIVMPALLRHARTTYGAAMRRALIAAGYDDIPQNGLYLIGGLALNEPSIPLGQLIKELRVSKQAAGQLVDTLVLRGYLTRATDESDRRKLSITLTERGKTAAAVQAAAREKIDADLIAHVGRECVQKTRVTLAALIDMAGAEEGDDDRRNSTNGEEKERRSVQKKQKVLANEIGTFLREYGRKAEKGQEPNDRSYDRWIEGALKKMKPEEVDVLINGEEDERFVPNDPK